MEDHGLVSDHWSELQDHQAGCRENGKEVQHHADLVRILKVVVAFSRRSTCDAMHFGIAEDAVKGQVL